MSARMCVCVRARASISLSLSLTLSLSLSLSRQDMGGEHLVFRGREIGDGAGVMFSSDEAVRQRCAFPAFPVLAVYPRPLTCLPSSPVFNHRRDVSAGCGEECIDLASEASKEAAMLKGGEQRVVRIATRCVMLFWGGEVNGCTDYREIVGLVKRTLRR